MCKGSFLLFLCDPFVTSILSSLSRLARVPMERRGRLPWVVTRPSVNELLWCGHGTLFPALKTTDAFRSGLLLISAQLICGIHVH